MVAREKLPSSDFALRFPSRFAAVISDARGALAGVSATAGNGSSGLLDATALRRLHEVFRLRIELELEVAAILWHTAEVVCAMADVTGVLERRGAPDAEPGRWLGMASTDEVGARRARLELDAHQAQGPGRWAGTEAPAAVETSAMGRRRQDATTADPGRWPAAA